MAIKLTNEVRSIIVDRLTAYISGTGGTAGSDGMLRVYTGTQPGTAGVAATGNMLVQIDGISWNAASNGTATITANKTGTAGTTGTAGWARLSGTDGTGYVIDGGCGTSSDFTIDTISITEGDIIALTSASIIQPAS